MRHIKLGKYPKNNVFLFFINNCYAIISFVSTILLVIETLFLLINYDKLSLKNYFIITLFALIILIIIAIALTIVIFNQSSVKKNMIDVKERSFKTYTDLAKSMGIISN